MMNPRDRTGFTLIEVLAALVVLSLVAATAAELATMTRSATRRAEQSQAAVRLLEDAAQLISNVNAEHTDFTVADTSGIPYRIRVQRHADTTAGSPTESPSYPMLHGELLTLELLDESGSVVMTRCILRATEHPDAGGTMGE